MIKFEGSLADEAKKFALKRYFQAIYLGVIFCVAIIIIPMIVLSFTVNLSILPIVIAAALPLGLLFIKPSEKNQKDFLPNMAFVDPEEQTIVVKGENFEHFRMFDEIVRVEDYGEWYYFVFPVTRKDISFVIQKNLITQGTLEEFENIFKDKIVHIEK